MTAVTAVLTCALTLAACNVLATSPGGAGDGGDANAGNSSVTLVGAGDIASCGLGGDEATARLIDEIPGTVFTAGDNAYESGSTAEYANCYAPTWGRFLDRTRPAPGNHEYNTAGAAPYYAYFGDRAGPRGLGYYSYALGAWHVIVLNSNLDARAGSEQERWLLADLKAHPARCTLAIWHHPLFSSGAHGNDPRMRDAWRDLHAAHVDIVVNGHDHDYERFAPQDADGRADPNGPREFVAGTGGASLRPTLTPRANSEVRSSAAWGVLRLTLNPAGYEWAFVPVAGGGFKDSGRAGCTP